MSVKEFIVLFNQLIDNAISILAIGMQPHLTFLADLKHTLHCQEQEYTDAELIEDFADVYSFTTENKIRRLLIEHPKYNTEEYSELAGKVGRFLLMNMVNKARESDDMLIKMLNEMERRVYQFSFMNQGAGLPSYILDYLNKEQELVAKRNKQGNGLSKVGTATINVTPSKQQNSLSSISILPAEKLSALGGELIKAGLIGKDENVRDLFIDYSNRGKFKKINWLSQQQDLMFLLFLVCIYRDGKYMLGSNRIHKFASDSFTINEIEKTPQQLNVAINAIINKHLGQPPKIPLPEKLNLVIKIVVNCNLLGAHLIEKQVGIVLV